VAGSGRSEVGEKGWSLMLRQFSGRPWAFDDTADALIGPGNIMVYIGLLTLKRLVWRPSGIPPEVQRNEDPWAAGSGAFGRDTDLDRVEPPAHR
jgi:hypothetical protein